MILIDVMVQVLEGMLQQRLESLIAVHVGVARGSTWAMRTSITGASANTARLSSGCLQPALPKSPRPTPVRKKKKKITSIILLTFEWSQGKGNK